jgi:hypothetical protein
MVYADTWYVAPGDVEALARVMEGLAVEAGVG